jgi:polyribonucleotide nucleotidyltransferase
MVLEGVVTNVTKFGAFVDIGVHQDGLVHISELFQPLHQRAVGRSQDRANCQSKGPQRRRQNQAHFALNEGIDGTSGPSRAQAKTTAQTTTYDG